MIERLAGDLWKADRSELAAGGRLSFPQRQGPVDRHFKARGSVFSPWSRIFHTECELFTLEWNLR